MSSIPSSASPISQTTPPGRRVTDAPTRMFHWLLALCFAGAYLTSDSERFRELHVVLGYSMAGLFGFRLLYGLLGPRHVRLSALGVRLRLVCPWLRSLKTTWSGPAQTSLAPHPAVNWRLGQNLVMTVSITAILLLLPWLVLSGYAIFHEWGGEWLEELHEAAGEGLLVLVILHICWVVLMSLVRQENQALPMLTGRQRGVGPDLVKSNARWLAVLVFVTLLSYWAWEWVHSPEVRSASVHISFVNFYKAHS